ncbi:ABC transporter ATP-binding protein [Amycolatopsis anabasis]|uniref:ABC transporter ATP-binding protein n=1 Tax=Amycolatopsis anabasis TaxID=1840409 RepID=UPI00131CBF8B|nr:ATP-binding cassette domain-containing protein [Amycolatopsis anabasis]
MIEVNALFAGYSGVAVVREVSFTVASGEVLALLGPNGAGKTTTLHTLAGLLPALGGEVVLEGRRVTGLRPDRLARLGLACVPQDRGVFHQLTVRENLRLVRGGGVATALEWFPELERLLNRRCGLCSGGEQQMLALAKAIAMRPRLLLIDELSLGLAPLVVRRLLPVVRRVARETGAAVVLTEQYVPLALATADQALVLRRGGTALRGPAADLAERPELLADSYLGAE